MGVVADTAVEREQIEGRCGDPETREPEPFDRCADCGGPLVCIANVQREVDAWNDLWPKLRPYLPRCHVDAGDRLVAPF